MTGLRGPVGTDLAETSRRLINLGPRTLGQDLALTRSPIWHLVSRALSPADLVAPSGPLVHVEGPALTIADQRVFAELFTTWARRGFPPDHLAPYTIASLGPAIRLTGKGGWQFDLVRASLRRLTSAVFADVGEDGSYTKEAGSALLAHYEVRSRPGAPCQALINEKTAQKLLGYPVTYLDAPTWDAIMAKDLLAARLWVWLEGERVREEWRWSLFPDAREAVVLGLRPRGRRTTPVAHLLTIDTWSRRRKVVERVRSACAIVMESDPRYELVVEPAVGDRGNYVLRCRRSARLVVAIDQDGIPPELGSAWHAASPLRRPSAEQLAVLRDLTSEWGIARVVEALAEASTSADPFRYVLDAVDRWRARRNDAWEETKARENAEAADVLGQIRGRIAERASAVAADQGRRQTDGPQSVHELLA